jgi:hypothetical protein
MWKIHYIQRLELEIVRLGENLVMGARRTSQLCRELTDGTAANGLSIGEAFGERTALLLAMPLESDDVTSGNTAVTTDTMG